MKKAFILILILVSAIVTNTNQLIHVGAIEDKKQVTVGFYDHRPYFYIDEKGQVTGIYHDIIQRIAKDVGFEVKYIMDGFSNIIENSKNNKIDLILGLHYTEDRNKYFYYSDLPIGTEEVAIFVHEDIGEGSLEKLSGMKLALVKHEENSKWISSLLKNRGIDVEEVYVSTYSEANQIFILEQVDATVAGLHTDAFEKVKPIYSYSSGSVYIGGNLNNRDLIEAINLQLQEYELSDKNPIEAIYNKYLPQDYSSHFVIGLSIALIASILFIPLFIKYPLMKRRYIRNKIRKQISDGQFLPYYQPIINPHTNEVIGVEALIRKNDPQKGILGPDMFIESIEKNDMLDELTLWLLQKVIEDYQTIQTFHSFKNQSFYISLNLSSREIESLEMVEKMVKIINQSNLSKDSICLEIIERFGVSNMNKIKQGVKELKKNGVKIAIDDFGVDYSNLKLLEVLDFDILKLDKYFADEMENSKIVRHTIGFLGQLTQKFDKCLVMEGVETADQKDFIKSYQHQQMYIQGYFYAKPMPLSELANLNLNPEKKQLENG